MKAKLFFTLFYLLTIPLFAQKDTSEYWYNGMLKMHLVTRGVDTLLFETYQENGFPALKAWGKDSAYQYDILGTLRAKHYNFKYTTWDISGQKSIYFDKNGKISNAISRDSVGHTVNFSYNKNRLKTIRESYKLNDSTTYLLLKDSNNKLTQSAIHVFSQKGKEEDIDTFYFPNGKIYIVSKMNRDKYPYGSEYLKINDETGKIILETTGEHVLKLEKDNSECLYGFKNQKGEWIIPPQYEEVKPLNLDFFIAYKPNEVAIFNEKGEKLLTKDWEYLDLMTTNDCGVRRVYPIGDEDNYLINVVTSNYQIVKDKLQNALLKFRKKGKYGVADIKGNILLEPKYDNIRNYSIDAYEVQIGQKWGVVNGKGDILVQPTYYNVTFTDLPNVFVVTDTFKNKWGYSEERHGLANEKSIILLPIRFANIIQIDSITFSARSSNYINEINERIFNIEKGQVFNDSFNVKYFDNYKILLVEKKDFNGVKKGVANFKGEWLFPLEYKQTELVSLRSKIEDYEAIGLVLKNQENKYGLYKIDDKNPILTFDYDNIQIYNSYNERSNASFMISETYYFGSFVFAQKKNKWQILKREI
jgi:WG containing repeat